LFQLEAFGKIKGDNDTRLNQVAITPWGELGTDSAAVLNSYTPGKKEEESVFYINKDNNHLIVLDVFNYLIPANAYTDAPEGGELKFTFYNDTSRSFYWVDFDINQDGHLTANGSADVFTHCGSNSTTQLEGSVAIGNVPGKNCKPLDYLSIYPVSSELRIE
jgi:hypothetical protein